MRTRTRMFGAVALLTASAALAVAQKPKSQKEIDALLAIQSAQQAGNADATITAVDNLIQKFADTEFKGWAYYLAANAARQKGDGPKTIIYAQLAIEADPKSFASMLLIAAELAQSTRENDLDKEEKLGKAEKYAKDGIALVAAAAKPNPAMTDDQWADVKKDYTADGHQDLGMVAVIRKKYDVAIAEFKAAIEGAAKPDPATMVRLGEAYSAAGKQDEAIATLTKVLDMKDLDPRVKQYAQQAAERVKAMKK